MENNKKNRYIFFSLLAFLALFVSFLFDRGLAVGLFVLFILFGSTIFYIYKKNMASKLLILLILIVFLVHLSLTLIVHYGNFNPFGTGRGDYILYDQEAKTIAHNLKTGNVNLREISSHDYSSVVGMIYYLTFPEPIIGELINLWFVALAIIFVFFIVRELGGSQEQAFLASIVANFYPSLAFYGSLLLKDAIIVSSCMISLFLTIKLIKNFSWSRFLLLYISLFIIIDLRIYIGLAAVVTFIFSWPLLSKVEIKRKAIYLIIIIILIGFLFQVAGLGYYGISIIKNYLYKINFYQNFVYNESGLSNGSTIKFSGYLDSFISIIFGPFPWQMKDTRQLAALFETIPWYIIFFFVIKGFIKKFKNNKTSICLIIFSLMVFAVLGVYVSNFGVITRIRIPALLSLICFLPFGLNWENKFLRKINGFSVKY